MQANGAVLSTAAATLIRGCPTKGRRNSFVVNNVKMAFFSFLWNCVVVYMYKNNIYDSLVYVNKCIIFLIPAALENQQERRMRSVLVSHHMLLVVVSLLHHVTAVPFSHGMGKIKASNGLLLDNVYNLLWLLSQ